jgi:SAM-dependent methyltransferase
LKLAEVNMAAVKCQREFICGNMEDAVSALPSDIDIIFSSYAVHHLSRQKKAEFILNCQRKLRHGGYFILVDGVLMPGQTRDEWLDALENRMRATQHMSPDELQFRMEHPRADDFPEAVETYGQIAAEQKWERFGVVVDKGIFAFMVFMNG